MGLNNIIGITIDSNTLIYFFENHQEYAQDIEDLFLRVESGEINAFLSSLSILEILVKPKRDKNLVLENKYKTLLLDFPNLYTIDINMKVIDVAASIRADYKIKTPDSIIISTAIITNSKYLISNDIRLRNVCNEMNLSLVTMPDLRNNKGYFYRT